MISGGNVRGELLLPTVESLNKKWMVVLDHGQPATQAEKEGQLFRFEFHSVEPGTHRVYAKAIGSEGLLFRENYTISDQFEVKDGQTTDIGTLCFEEGCG